MSSTVALIGAALVLLVVAGLLVAAETALGRVGRSRAAELAATGRRGAPALARLVDQPGRWVNLVLLALVAATVTQAVLVGVVAARLWGPVGVAVAVVVDVVVVFVVAEVAPKTLAIQHHERVALVLARPVAALAAVAPLRWASRGLIGLANVAVPGRGLAGGPFVSQEALLAMADAAVEGEVLDEDERRLIGEILDFGDTVVREVMVPRPDMVVVPSHLRVADVVEITLLNGLSRMPVVGQGIDEVLGLVHARDLMRAERDGGADQPVGTLARPARFVPETKRIAELLAHMQAEQFHMAVVVDEYGATAGLVTLEDLIEELVGEIADEFDREVPRVEDLGGGAVRIDARMAVDEVNELIGARLPEGDWDTVGGLVFHLLGRIPGEGEAVRTDRHQLRAERVDGRRIGRVRIEPVPGGAEPGATTGRGGGDAGSGSGGGGAGGAGGGVDGGGGGGPALVVDGGGPIPGSGSSARSVR